MSRTKDWLQQNEPGYLAGIKEAKWGGDRASHIAVSVRKFVPESVPVRDSSSSLPSRVNSSLAAPKRKVGIICRYCQNLVGCTRFKPLSSSYDAFRSIFSPGCSNWAERKEN